MCSTQASPLCLPPNYRDGSLRHFSQLGRSSERPFNGNDNLIENLRFADRQLAERAAIQFDVGQLQAVNESRIGHATHGDSRIQASDPQRSQIALLQATIIVGVNAPFDDVLNDGSPKTTTTTNAAFGLFENSFLFAMADGTRLNTHDRLSSPS